ncbi:MAG: hypothetical protein KC933_37210 [Myxococcales bacterium]|nr:hypothetical protein [Myxococcales bacterium]MCB9648054.1 hypothetical protein [Deltaproteobacteria bacterium]
MLPTRALIALIGFGVIACGSDPDDPLTCDPTSVFAEVPPTWDYVPYNPHQDFAGQQPSVGSWRDTLVAWTFTLEGSWTDGSTDAVTFEFDGATTLEVQEVHSTDESCNYSEVTSSVAFDSEYRLSFADGAYTLTGPAKSRWLGWDAGYAVGFYSGSIAGPDCPCTLHSTLEIYSGIDPIDQERLAGPGGLTLETETSTRIFQPDSVFLSVAAR